VNTCAGPNRFLVLAAYAVLVVVLVVVVGCRALPASEVPPTGSPSRSADADPH